MMRYIYIEQNPLPDYVRVDWDGFTYINVVWQDDMAIGKAWLLKTATDRNVGTSPE